MDDEFNCQLCTEEYYILDYGQYGYTAYWSGGGPTYPDEEDDIHYYQPYDWPILTRADAQSLKQVICAPCWNKCSQTEKAKVQACVKAGVHLSDLMPETKVNMVFMRERSYLLVKLWHLMKMNRATLNTDSFSAHMSLSTQSLVKSLGLSQQLFRSIVQFMPLPRLQDWESTLVRLQRLFNIDPYEMYCPQYHKLIVAELVEDECCNRCRCYDNSFFQCQSCSYNVCLSCYKRVTPTSMKGGRTGRRGAHSKKCVAFMKKGFCKFGDSCKFDHPGVRGGCSGRQDAGGNECFAFMEKGSCKYGDSCKFDHHGVRGGRYGRQDAGGNECFAFMEKGSCKFGDSCKFVHPGVRVGRSGRRDTGANECFAFMEKGSCKFGDTCKFDHPGVRHSRRI